MSTFKLFTIKSLMALHDYDKILTRLTIIIQRLYEGEELSMKELTEEFNVSSKTIQRDFNERLIRFPIERVGKRWKMMDGFRLEKSRTSEEEITLDILEVLSENMGSVFSSKTKALFSKIKNETNNPIYARVAIEDISQKLPLIKELEAAIQQNIMVTFEHNGKKREVQPYRIVNFEGYWYLFGEEKKDKKVKTYYLKDIELLITTEETFEKDESINKKLDGAINVWFDSEAKPYDVELLIDKKIAKYFKRRPISKNQIVLSEEKDGSITILITITNDMEILSTIKYWIPYIKVISPKSLQNKILEDCNNYISSH